VHAPRSKFMKYMLFIMGLYEALRADSDMNFMNFVD
jgi:hypothetical protein